MKRLLLVISKLLVIGSIIFLILAFLFVDLISGMISSGVENYQRANDNWKHDSISPIDTVINEFQEFVKIELDDSDSLSKE